MQKRTLPNGKIAWVEDATYKIKAGGHTHTCAVHAIKVKKIPERGTLLMCWFISIIWQPNPPVFGPYVYGELDGKAIQDNRIEFLSELAEVKLQQMLARATGKRYQETPFLRLGGAPTLRKVYRE